MDTSRRSLLQALPMLAAVSAFAADGTALTSFVKPFGELPVKQNGPNQSRPILDGVLHDGEHLEVHETILAAGSEPHPPHRHVHEELFLLVKGNVAVTIEGKTTVIGPGSAAFVQSNQLHGVHNPGPEKAQYFVVATGT
ncbi:MAG TPA: cupin domain-containing protein [Acidobacteriaceae bacterium]|nr:cupin domain-containing protein [Acidobacteriaceae bacterium]